MILQLTIFKHFDLIKKESDQLYLDAFYKTEQGTKALEKKARGEYVSESAILQGCAEGLGDIEFNPAILELYKVWTNQNSKKHIQSITALLEKEVKKTQITSNTNLLLETLRESVKDSLLDYPYGAWELLIFWLRVEKHTFFPCFNDLLLQLDNLVVSHKPPRYLAKWST